MSIAAGDIFAFLTVVVVGLIGFIVRQLSTSVRDLRDSHSNHKTHVAETYQTKEEQRDFKDDLHRELNELKGMIKAMFDKFDRLLHTKRGPDREKD